jgi:cell division protein FtsZ
MHGVQSVTDLMVRPGIINLDFADVETVMASMGKAMMGTGEADGEGRAMKAAEMAISNPLIDDYTLKGAKGLLVNITGGEDLKLFEVDEVVNKIRAEVDVEAEVIIGAITDPALDGKIRVSIVATSLDGQQPEAKSVINMVHRIQNRNPGYSDFSNSGSAQSFNFSTTNTPVSNGANALKLENEITNESMPDLSSSEIINENNQNVASSGLESIDENQSTGVVEESFSEEATESVNKAEEPSNGLENFAIEEETPGLFDTDSDDNFKDNIQELSSLDTEDTLKDDDEEDDLEIPAFLRRQKN